MMFLHIAELVGFRVGDVQQIGMILLTIFEGLKPAAILLGVTSPSMKQLDAFILESLPHHGCPKNRSLFTIQLKMWIQPLSRSAKPTQHMMCGFHRKMNA